MDTNDTQPQVAAPVPAQSIGKLAAALAKAQGMMAGAKKDSLNPHFKSSYADLASVWEACREPLSANELAVVQFPESDGPKVTVRTLLIHSSGERLESAISAKAANDTPQAIGSAITYLRRYSLMAVVGIAPEDDDGNGAQGSQPARTEAPPRTATAPRQQPPATETERKSIEQAIGKEMKARGVSQATTTAWRDSMGYPSDTKALTIPQLEELLEYVRQFTTEATA